MLFLSGDDKTKEELAMTDMGIEKAYDELQRISEDEVMRERAIARDKWLSDQATRREQARREGKELKVKKKLFLACIPKDFQWKQLPGYMKMSEEKVLSIINQIQ